MKTAALICRPLLGFIFLAFGLDYFLHFLEKMVAFPPISDKAGNYLGAFAAVGYFFPVLKSIEIICGLFLLFNRYAALNAVMLFPVTLNILLLHAFLAPQFLFLSITMILLNVVLLYVYRKSYAGMLKAVPSL